MAQLRGRRLNNDRVQHGGTVGLALPAAAPMLGAAVVLGRAVGIVAGAGVGVDAAAMGLGFMEALAFGLAETLALAGDKGRRQR